MKITKEIKYSLIIFGIAIKVGYLFFFAYFQPGVENITNQLYATSGDFHDYVDPVENLIREGKYYFGNNNFAGRMPGYTVVLLPLRFFFSQENTLTITVFLQAILSGISVFYLALVSFKLTGKKFIFWSVYILFLFSTYVGNWDRYILTESFAASALIFSIHFFQTYFSEKKKRTLFFSGLFFTWAVFLRPFLAPAILIYLWIIFSSSLKKVEFSKYTLAVFVFLSSFIFIDGLWIYRNYEISGDFIPLQSTTTKGGKTSKLVETLNGFITSFGGDRIPWHPGSEAMWFTTDDYLRDHGFERPSDKIFPEFIFSENLTLDTLKQARDFFNSSRSFAIMTEKEAAERNAILILERFSNQVKKNHPFKYYIGSRLRIMFRFVVLQPYTYYFNYTFSEAGLFGKVVKLVNYLANIFVVLSGLLGIFLVFGIQNNMKLFFVLIPLFIFSLFPFVFLLNEYRFLVLAYPFLLVNGVFFFDRIYGKLSEIFSFKKLK